MTTILIGKDFFPPIITIISIIPSNYALDESGGHFPIGNGILKKIRNGILECCAY